MIVGWHVLRLMRAHSAAGAALAVAAGATLAGAVPERTWIAPMALAFLLAAAGNVDNDVQDVAIDRHNRPGRPLPAGNLSRTAACRIAWGLAVAGLILAGRLGPIASAGSVAALLLTAWYTRSFKNHPFCGPLLVGGITAAALGYGGIIAGNPVAVFWPMVALGLFFAGREVVKTMYDTVGDRAGGVRTAAVAWGRAGALRVATVLFGAAVGCLVHAIVPGPAAWVGGGLLLAVTSGLLVPLWREPHNRALCRRFLAQSKVLGIGTLLIPLILAVA